MINKEISILTFKNSIKLYNDLYINDKIYKNRYQQKYYEIIFDKIKNSYNYYKENKDIKDNYQIFKVNDEYINTIELLNSKFVSPNIKGYIYNNLTHIIKYTFTIKTLNDSRNITLIFGIFNNNFNKIREFKNYIIKIKILLKFIFEFSSFRCSNNITLYLLLTPLYKELPYKKDILNNNNVNSAVTTSCTYNGELLIYRKEEWFKVLIHELFHLTGLDFSTMDIYKYSKKIKKHFNNINSSMLLYESYCEFWATILNSCFKVFFYQVRDKIQNNKRAIYKKTFVNEVNKYIEDEKKFSLFQMIKIIKFINNEFTYRDFIMKTIPIRNYYREKTNVFSYYFIKTILLLNNESFFKWCNNNNINLLKFNNNNNTLLSFIQFIINKSTKKDFIENTDIMDILYDDIINHTVKTNEINNLLYTMRMTIR
jgi:hypothetical protein